MVLVGRVELEERERALLGPLGRLSDQSLGRAAPEEPDPLRTCFQCDRDRILHSKSFRRLAHKTQVFLAPEGDHYRTRLIHTLEVAQVARSISRPLGLNEDLTEAIALGHDLGHTPFGHEGERPSRAVLPAGGGSTRRRESLDASLPTTSRAPASWSSLSVRAAASTSPWRWSTASAATREAFAP